MNGKGLLRTDLHIHSCLSPCGDGASTPQDLVGMAKLCGLDLIALTDHNTAQNCPAAAAAAEEYEIGFLPGVEVTTSEDVHMVCLFPSAGAAVDFGDLIRQSLSPIENRPEIFGIQQIVGPDGEPAGTEKILLINNASCYSLDELPALCARYGGLCYPAHVDREANGLLAVLGVWPEGLGVRAVEIRGETPPAGVPKDLKIIRASDAHNLADIPEGGFPLPLRSADFEGLRQWLEQK